MLVMTRSVGKSNLEGLLCVSVVLLYQDLGGVLEQMQHLVVDIIQVAQDLAR